MGWDEIVIAETQQNVSFADTGVTDNQEFDEPIVGIIFLGVHWRESVFFI